MPTETFQEEHTVQLAADRAGVATALFLFAMVAILLIVATFDRSAPAVAQNGLAAATPIPAGAAPMVIAFVRNDEGGLSKWMKRIYLMNPDGSRPMRVTKEVQGWDAAWSPEGSRIAFTCPLDGNLEICLVHADGSHWTRLTNNAAIDRSPTWSPDGSRIAFASNRDGNFQIYVMDDTGDSPVAVTHTATNEMQPAWSPDGEFIAFVSDRAPKENALFNRDIFVMNADGSGAASLTAQGPTCFRESPAWSPDGSEIAFAADCAELRFQIYVMKADGTRLTRLTISQGHDRNPTWSPDGEQIAFDSTRDLPSAELDLRETRAQIYVMNADGTGQVRLTSDPTEFTSHPSWSWSLNTMARAHPVR